ncbi:ATP-binding SpoIIE family protein phosphatase [Streptomyces sp. SPB074]|uniref:ATP-binding SpoIIE family protein phosphatase n=1 Tax=Streptomyces sp. (strain SPB074) TaxID=465543 RepID=UPI00017F101B|nr:SpoIIE family protein phosphatase [Streptomyces sp. SPB074]EDY42874.1 regulatory protein [Streptomyces sp. SPB074]
MGSENVAPTAAEALSALHTGLWRWDDEAGTIAVDAEAARLIGLPPRPATLSESAVRARFHPSDWNEIQSVITLAAAEETLGEARLRVMDEQGNVVRVVRTRSRPTRPVEAPEGDGAANEHDVGDTSATWLGSDVRAPAAGRSPRTSPGFVLVGTLQEITEPSPGAVARAPVTGDWRRSREAFLLDAGRALAEARSTTEVLRVAAGLSMPGFSPDGLAVFGIENDHLTVVGHHGHRRDAAAPFAEVALDADYPAAEVIRTGRAIYLSSPKDYRERYPATWPLVAAFNRKSWAFLPLVAAGRTMGAWLAAFTYPVSFTADERSVLATVARMLAQALSRAGIADSQRALSEDLQRSMLPRLGPAMPGMSLAARYVPTGGGLRVGGDWYDMIPLPSGRTALVIGDVQGHDVRAAGLMGQLRIAVRAYASEGHRADVVLTRATRFLHGISETREVDAAAVDAEGEPDDPEDDPRFATCLYVEVDPANGTLEIARAGHPEPAVRMADGTMMRRPVAGGLPLGIDPDADYPTTRLVLEPGETIMMCTDGLIETGGHDLDTGWDRLRRAAESYEGEDVEGLADALLGAVHGPDAEEDTGPLRPLHEDDIAVLLLRRALIGSSSRLRHPRGRRAILSVAQAEPERVAGARRQLRDLLHDWPEREQVDSAVLMCSEMLTNVLVHTEGDALLIASVSGPPGARRMRVEVMDDDDTLPHRRDPGELASSGRGLVLMELLADDWGVSPRGEGKSIWFELREEEGEEEEGEEEEGEEGEGDEPGGAR